ncbi:MAG: GGDEF domain-containing protein [Lachnospiraceae bacterium]|nr:GGDEF domain-containing protein [Lachnospiraceae bacterium]
MQEKKDKKVVFITIVYLLGLLGMFSLLLAIHIGREKPEQNGNQETYQNITELWTLDKEGTKPVDVKKYGEYMDPESGVLSIYYLLPELDTDTSFVYRSKDVYTRVLVDGEEIYKTSVYDSPFYNKSPGNLWNMLNISSEYSGKYLELQITMVYDTNAITVDSLYLGDKADIIIGLCTDNIFGIVISLLLMLLGVVLMVIDFLPSYGRSRKHHGLWWVGIYALLTGVWSLIETNVVQFFVDDMRILQLMDNMLMMLTTIPLILYLNTELGILKNRVMRIFSYMSVGYVLLCVWVQYKGEKDMHHMLNPSLYLMLVIDVVMSVWLFWQFIKMKRAGKPAVNCFLMFLGVTSTCTCTVLEIVRSLRVDRMDRAGLIRIGMLILCICFGIGSQIDTYKIVEQGLKYDLISKLAYSDGLTGLGNRTAYLEQLESYENNPKEITQLGIVYLDVNNLKKVNDNQGHDYGDELIRSAAKIIETSFGKFGKSYRIGGDEFCVLMTGGNLDEEYGKGLSVFQQLIDEANALEIYTCAVQIAHGFAVCKEITKEKIEEAIAVADNAMYKNKTELKGNA